MNKNFNLKLDSHESLKIGVILSLVGGILDAHTFLFRNGVFANTQTGNIVLLALFIYTNKIDRTIQCIFSIIAFIIGIGVTEFVKIKLKNQHFINYICIILSIEILFLSTLTTIPKNINNKTVIVVIAFVCSLQTNAFRSLKGSPYSTTMCTGNLRSASSSFFKFIWHKDIEEGVVCFRYFIIIISFFMGAVVGRILTNYLEQNTLFICSLLLTAAFIIILIENKKFIKQLRNK